MKNFTLLLLLFLSSVTYAQRADNYKPDNPNIPFTETNLPVIFINTQAQQIDRDERITVKMKIIHNGDGQVNYMDTLAHPGQTVDYDGEIGLKYRGNSSFTNSDKKPYAIRPLDAAGKKAKVSLLGMGKDNDWALLAPYADKSMIRDVFAFILARPYFEYVPTGRFCEMIMDGTYYGVFILSERVRTGKFRLDLPDPGEEGDKLTGGYHLEVDRDDEPVYYSKHTPVNSSGNMIYGKRISYQYKSPEIDDLTENQKNYIHNHIDEFENSFSIANYTDPEVGYRKYIDVTSFIDYLLSTEFCHNVDGYRLSTNLYKYRDSVDPRFKMSLWDMNLGFGNADYSDGWKYDTWAYNFNDANPSDDQLVPFWWYKLLKDDSFTKELKERWTLYRETDYSDEHIEQTIDSLTTLLNGKGAQERNSQAWPRWGRYVWPNKYIATSYADEISYLKNWIKQRLIFMDKMLLGIEPEKDKYKPLTIASGFNSDIIAEEKPAKSYSSVATDDEGWVFYSANIQEQGGLPIDGKLFSSSSVDYQLAPYAGNNALLMKTSVTSAELTFDSPVSTKGLSILGTSANGTSSLLVTVCYADETKKEVNMSFADWFGSSSGTAIYDLARIRRDGSSSQEDKIDARYQFRLFENSIDTDVNKKIVKIQFRKISGGYPMILAVSGIDAMLTGLSGSESNSVLIYPNPADRNGTLRIESAYAGMIELHSLDGMTLLRQDVVNPMCEISLNGISPGTYIVTFKGNNTVRITKIIIK